MGLPLLLQLFIALFTIVAGVNIFALMLLGSLRSGQPWQTREVRRASARPCVR